ncbi:hypothetical protein V8C26DRAFT_431580 [Trichoderma gracile]
MGYQQYEAQREQAMQQQYMALGAQMLLQQQAQQEPQKQQWMARGAAMAMHKMQREFYNDRQRFEEQQDEAVVEQATRCGFEIEANGDRVFVCRCGECGDVWGDL